VIEYSIMADDEKQIDSMRGRQPFFQRTDRLDVGRKNRWDAIFAMGQAAAAQKGLTEEDVTSEIRAYRESKARRP
jgi:hypothetical protein